MRREKAKCLPIEPKTPAQENQFDKLCGVWKTRSGRNTRYLFFRFAQSCNNSGAAADDDIKFYNSDAGRGEN